MTRKEFVQQAVLAMIPKVVGKNGMFTDEQMSNMICDAENLSDEMVRFGYLPDDDSE